jgi:hypothetical protein
VNQALRATSAVLTYLADAARLFCADRMSHAYFSIFLLFFSDVHRTDFYPDSAGPFTGFHPVGFAIFVPTSLGQRLTIRRPWQARTCRSGYWTLFTDRLPSRGGLTLDAMQEAS